MGDARGKANVDLWLKDAPAEVSTKTEELLARVRDLRTEQTIYPAQDAILRARAHAARRRARGDPGAGPLPRARPGHGPLVLRARRPAPPAQPAQRLQGARGGPRLRATSHGRPHRLGTAGCPSPQHHAHGARARRELACAARLAGPHKLPGQAHGRAATAHLLPRVGPPCRKPRHHGGGRRARHGNPRGREARAHLHAPSPLSANRAGGGLVLFMGSRPFSQANAFLQAHGERPIAWA